MIRLPKLYPDLWLPRLGYILADLAVLLWLAVWVNIGLTVYNAVMTLSIIADGVIATGQKLNDIIAQIQQGVSGLVFVGPKLHDALNPLYGIPSALITQGQSELVAIHNLAVLLGSVVAGIPIVITLFRFIPWRARKTRGFRYLNRLLRKPGATAVTTTMQVLAGRALYTLPYDRLLHYSADPIAEWREGRYYNLARATMAEEGLDVRRYLRRVQGLAPPPEPVDVPTIQDEQA